MNLAQCTNNAFILVYDVTKAETLESVAGWCDQIRQSINELGSLILVGNKCDLKEERQVSFAAAAKVAEDLGIAHHIEVSARDDVNVEQAFVTILAQCLQQAQQHSDTK